MALLKECEKTCPCRCYKHGTPNGVHFKFRCSAFDPLKKLMTAEPIRLSCIAIVLSLACAASLCAQTSRPAPDLLKVRNAGGFQLLVVAENNQPTLRIVLPGRVTSDRSIEVLFPEHVTVVEHGNTAARQLYLFRPGQVGERPDWRRIGHSLEYQRDLQDGVHLLARATLERDGVLFHYEFSNSGKTAYDMILAVTDPRLTSIFRDLRLERTYVHHADGFELLASETPERLTLPLDRWFPVRYLASFTWPVPAQLMDRRNDGIAYYNKSRAVDQPFLATLSEDRKWVIASVARMTGNVWSNPKLTCQHVDPQASLAPGQRSVLEVKIFVLRGSLNEALQRAIRQRKSLK